ncbi:hypothetical protein ES703_63357 [subsurface metagenome]
MIVKIPQIRSIVLTELKIVMERNSEFFALNKGINT